MATIVAGVQINSGDTIDGDGGAPTAKNLMDLVQLATITNLTEANMHTDNVNGAVATPSLRKVTASPWTDTTDTTAVSAAEFLTGRLSSLTSAGYATADKLIFGSSIKTINSTAPATGKFLGYNGTTLEMLTPSGTSENTGTSTIASTGTTVQAAATSAAFNSVLLPGYYIKPAGETARRIVSITDADTLIVDTAWSPDISAGTAWVYIIASQPRPFNNTQTKSANFSVVAADAGTTFLVSGNVIASLAAASTFVDGDTITCKKVTDDGLAMILAPNGADTIDGVNANVEYQSFQASVTLQRTSSATWRIVSEKFRQGSIVQRVRTAFTSAVSGASGTFSITGVPAQATGTELMTQAITPKSAFNKLRVNIHAIVANASSANRMMIGALFQDATSASIAATVIRLDQDANGIGILTLGHEKTSGTTSSTTFKLRGGLSSANTWWFNADTSGGTIFGGVASSFIEIEEVCI